ncbi:multifunctional non-homologous end joining DNA repair protein LigD [Mycobacterium sp. CBMA293]|uniref:non-homologous end-joining DNA ligase n=1 Tax=unclassified Mycolicibacterium TaxID=2636767 RepID=UPI00132B2BE8|nr:MULTISPECIES: non-homologous end-joining DNA ligase [unclassified Mycolicibacterium]MUL49626.1 multifunctional non-homologous end joining DNA repair protein LigD [Mycolicibacterium sp. CBMA 360]MUL97099.1 multifunctional non-homologous end joining DNA repair protein LigD [Mycolicibacterium sp. CBMA 230]MUL61540.1 multifunctional non-homologous end joining DNA repair protein LigD [Mycolicibacterium sp. CBMA 335]MUL74275.1 multifunctional non-homologous end joining DNA repair protein LigD [Myc
MEQFGRVRLTNPDKVLYPATGTTKAEVFDYYLAVADAMLPHIAGRPATRTRWPNGVEQQPFFEKHLASSAPDWLERGAITHRSGTTVYPVIDTAEGLAWIAQQAALEVHVPQWRFASGTVGPATRIVFDLDPGDDVTMTQLCGVARAVRELVAGMDLTAYPLTSGSKGLHLYVPLATPVSSRGASAVAKRVAQQLESSMAGLVTATMTRSVRAGKVFMDWSQNSAAKTTVAPYSLRGRDEPTVAAPRTWDELDDPDLRQLRFDEVLARLARDGDLLAGLDVGAPVADRLTTYRSMRDPASTPEPVPAAEPESGENNRFVIQEHHARRLHYDFRLERDGVLVSWAVPKNLPDTSTVNHLAVHTEDHPLEYATFEGDIPKGEYGGGHVTIWDAGTYDTEKFRDTGSRGEVIVNLHGTRVTGRYVLIQTDGKNWLVRRMKDQQLQPMLATHGSVSRLSPDEWAFEGKWDGYRLLVDADHGRLRLTARSGRDVTGEFPQLHSVAADLADHHVVLDGEVVALVDGVPSFGAMQNRGPDTQIEFWCFDILSLDGRGLVGAKYRDRRKLLETLASDGALTVPPLLPAEHPLEFASARGFEGVVAKKWNSGYRPGRSQAWIKDKFWRTQEVVIGGWRAGEGGRTSGIGALLVGVPAEGGLQFVGRVGTGFTDKMLGDLRGMLKPLESSESPFTAPLSALDAKGVTYVRPELVGEVRYSERTTDSRLRQPSWRGLRPDKTPAEITWE